MKTDPRLIAVLEALQGHQFNRLDWETFSGCEADDPWIAGFDNSLSTGLVVVADGDTLSFYTDKGMTVALRTCD